jgi:succinate dehydrogenase/fumarate reductase-like Fe-S protein
MTDTLRVEIWRGTESGQFQPFAIPRREHQTVLDVVTEIQREHDATLSYKLGWLRDWDLGPSCGSIPRFITLPLA